MVVERMIGTAFKPIRRRAPSFTPGLIGSASFCNRAEAGCPAVALADVLPHGSRHFLFVIPAAA